MSVVPPLIVSRGGVRRLDSLLVFVPLTFLVTWIYFGAAVALSEVLFAGPAPRIVARGWVLLGTITPGLVALWLTWRVRGAEGLRALLARAFQWRVAARWYAFAILYMAVAKLVMAVVHRLATGVWPQFGTEPWLLMAAAIAVSFWIQAGEELGWRGLALSRLAARFGLGTASVVLGLIWALWHLPLFYLRGADTFGQSFLVWTLQVIAISVAMAWLYARTDGSLLLVMLMHASINNTLGIVPAVTRAAANPFDPHASLTSWLMAAVLWAVGVWCLIRMRGMKDERIRDDASPAILLP